MAQAAFQLTAQEVAERIGWPLREWPGNCYAVSCRMLKKGVLRGRPVYGNYLGPVEASSMFHGKPVVRHGWIERDDGMVVDPTRWVFEGVEPYIHVGMPTMEYDEGANVLRAMHARPAPEFDPGKRMVAVPGANAQAVFAALLGMNEVRAEVNAEQAFWLGNLALQRLGADAEVIYQALTDMGLSAFVPTDNYKKVMQQAWA